MTTSRSFKDLVVWQKSFDLVLDIYKICNKFPKGENYILADQMKRSSISIPSNIAEGSKRKSGKEFIQFLHIASGSAAELETQLLISKQIYPKIDPAIALNKLFETQKMLYVLTQKISEKC